jgi:uncharacterized low-complexity protein
MKHFNLISKILLVVVAVAGLAIGMSAVANSDNSTNSATASIFSDNNIIDSNCGSGKCGGGDAKETTTDAKCGGDNAKAAVSDKADDAKCGEGKCGDGKCGGDNNAAIKPNFMDIDINGDGKVSKTEFADHGTNEFPNKDSNSDGKLTSDECMMFDSFNTDGNEYLSKAEFEAGHNSMFAKIDSNNDGFIDANEAKSMHNSDSAKCGDGKSSESKCGGDNAKAAVSDKAGDAKCGAGKCG